MLNSDSFVYCRLLFFILASRFLFQLVHFKAVESAPFVQLLFFFCWGTVFEDKVSLCSWLSWNSVDEAVLELRDPPVVRVLVLEEYATSAWFIILFSVLEVKPRALHILASVQSTTELLP